MISTPMLAIIINKFIKSRVMYWGNKILSKNSIEVFEKGIYIRNIYGKEYRIFDIFIPWNEITSYHIQQNSLTLRTRDGSEIELYDINESEIEKLIKFLETSSSCSK